jgi:hypothetical protein
MSVESPKHGGLGQLSGRPRRVDYGAVAKRLVDKSDAGKLPWKATDKPSQFACALEGDFTIECSRFEHHSEVHYALVMTDIAGTELFSITSAEYTSDLGRLWESARQTALNVRQKIEKLNDILDRL